MLTPRNTMTAYYFNTIPSLFHRKHAHARIAQNKIGMHEMSNIQHLSVHSQCFLVIILPIYLCIGLGLVQVVEHFANAVQSAADGQGALCSFTGREMRISVCCHGNQRH